MGLYFPFADYWSFYALFTVFVLVLLLIDLGVFHRTAHEISPREALIWSIVWIGLALVFNLGFYYYCLAKFAHVPDGGTIAHTLALEFLAGYLIEKALSVDNIFVFVVVFAYFGIPPKYQHRILFFGILGALVFRGLFIALGSIIMTFHWVQVVFGVILMATGIKLCFVNAEQHDLSNNRVLKFLHRYLPVDNTVQGQRFIVRRPDGWFVTPLMIALLFIELSDIVFAIDSVPAIFAVTKEPMIVYASNVFAILGLRALYFLLASAIHRFHLLKYGLGIILAFVGAKMSFLHELMGGKFPIGLSLAIIGSVLVVSIFLSLVIKPRSVSS